MIVCSPAVWDICSKYAKYLHVQIVRGTTLNIKNMCQGLGTIVTVWNHTEAGEAAVPVEEVRLEATGRCDNTSLDTLAAKSFDTAAFVTLQSFLVTKEGAKEVTVTSEHSAQVAMFPHLLPRALRDNKLWLILGIGNTSMPVQYKYTRASN